MKLSFRLAVALAALGFAVGCEGCRPQDRTDALGEPRFTIEVDGVNVEATEVDFGIVPMTKKVERVVTVTNIGRGPLQLDGFTKEGEGAAVQVGTLIAEPNPVFGLPFEPIELAVGETRELRFFFQPPEEMRPVVDHEVLLKVAARNVSAEGGQVTVKLKGRAIRGECEWPTRIDFGAVARGDSFEVSELLKNRRMVDSFPRVGDIQSAQGADVFTLTSDSPRGDLTLAPGRERAVKVVFTPTEVRDYTATMVVLPADGCPEVTTRLVGTGVDNVLSWQPATLDFGYVQPGVTVNGEVTFLNRSFKPVQLSGLATREGSNPSNIYRVVAANMGDATRLTVPAGSRDAATNDIVPGSAKVTVSFRPAVLGPRNGTLAATSDVRSNPTVNVPLRGFGGGPDIDVLPAQTLNFGRIAYFAGTTSAATRKLTVRNVGTAPAVADPRANLRLGAMGAGRPYWTVTPKNAESAADEICVGVFDAMAGTCSNDLP
ncbi:MAG: choice-of-anchor D domain-containing protein, partial [Myxococcaceae bacterium]|nr:choice-of-anchor D domain-containing protein [Myxococcaceae bacterium]